MKINYKNTALGFLDDPMNFPLYCPEYTDKMTVYQEQDFLYSVRQATANASAGFKEMWKNNVQYITLPFHKAYTAASPKIHDLVKHQAFEDAGTLIVPWKGHTQTIFYAIETNGKYGEDWKFEVLLMLLTKSPHSEEFGLDIFVYMPKFDEENDAAKYRERIWKGFVEQGRDVSWWVADLMRFKTFLKFADIQTKFVNGGRREKHLGEKYVNETKHRIEILDSTYFTTISRTEGFGVRGHFRMQPCGPKMADRRLIWVSDFEKTGYTRKAKIIEKNNL